MKKSILRQIIIKEIQKLNESQEFELAVIKKKAKLLGLTIKTSSVSWGYAATIFDTKSKLSTKGGVFSPSPEFSDFSARLKQLRDFVGTNKVVFNGNKVTGLSSK